MMASLWESWRELNERCGGVWV